MKKKIKFFLIFLFELIVLFEGLIPSIFQKIAVEFFNFKALRFQAS